MQCLFWIFFYFPTYQDMVLDNDSQFVYLDKKQTRYIHPKMFRNLYNLSHLDLNNNQLQSFEIDFNLIYGETKLTIVNLTGNFDLSLLSK